MKRIALLLLGILATPVLAASSATPAPKKKPPGPLGSALDRPGSASTPKPAPKPAAPPPATPPPAPNLAGAAAARGLSFEARTLSHGGGQGGSFGSGDSEGKISKTRLRKSQTTLEIVVRNLAREPDTAHFDWFFVGKGVTTEDTFVWDQGVRDVTIPAASQKTETVESEEIVSAETRTTSGSSSSSSSSPPTTSEKKSGARSYGWIIRMFVGGHLVKVQASNTRLEQIGRDPGQLTQLLKQKPPLAPGESEKSTTTTP